MGIDARRRDRARAVAVGLGTTLVLAAIVLAWPSRDGGTDAPDTSTAGGRDHPRGHPPPGRKVDAVSPVRVEPSWIGERDLDREQKRTDGIEKLLIAHLKGENGESLRRAREEALAVTREYPDQVYGHLLLAYGHQLAGDADGERAALEPLAPWGRATYRALFERRAGQIPDLLECNRTATCLVREARQAQRFPGATVFNFWDRPLEDGPIDCGGRVLHPSRCPTSTAIFERVSWRNYCEDRARQWSADAPEPFTMAELVDLMGVGPGTRVADVGGGIGYFTWVFADAVGEAGRVYSIEIDPTFTGFVEELAADLDLPQVEAILVDPGDLGLEPAAVDVGFVCDVFQDLFNEDQMAQDEGAPEGQVIGDFVDGLAGGLAPGGTLVVVDTAKPWGRRAEHTLTVEQISEALAPAGFSLESRHDMFQPTRFLALYRAPDDGAP